MSRNVFILGAGASAQAGAPMMSTFIRAAQDIQRGVGVQPLYPKEQEHFDLVFKARRLLQQVHSKSELDINNIESLFGVFEMAALLGRLGPLTDAEIQQLPNAVRYVISKTIESCLQYPIGPRENILPPPPYDSFVKIVRQLSKREPGSVSVITFNYDVGLDYAFHYNSIPFEYRCGNPNGLDPGRKTSPWAIDLLKLHGSLNWGRCNKCSGGRVVPYLMGEFFASDRIWLPVLEQPKNRNLTMSNVLVTRSCPACGSSLAENPVIVPPTWNKGNAHIGLSSVWRAAADHLSGAENVFVIGYSLPITDDFFRYFYSLSTVGEAILETFMVVDKDANVFTRFKGILGSTARACFVPYENTFEHSLPTIMQRLRLPPD
jgi:hypothetical protein